MRRGLFSGYQRSCTCARIRRSYRSSIAARVASGSAGSCAAAALGVARLFHGRGVSLGVSLTAETDAAKRGQARSMSRE
jgi:hypothetical protein